MSKHSVSFSLPIQNTFKMYTKYILVEKNSSLEEHLVNNSYFFIKIAIGSERKH